MASINIAKKVYTHEGAPAYRLNPELELRRSVMACMLWENQFYESGETIATRIQSLIQKVKPEIVASIAIEAREKMKLRHVPLLIVREMARLKSHKHLVAATLNRVIQRPDELTEFLAIYWNDKRQPISAQVKRGLAKAFTKFNEYSLAKYNRDGAVKLKDVLFLSHSKPINEEQALVYKKLINNELQVPDTWEVSLSSGADKKETWERLLDENKLGALALLRNLRNMNEAKVSENKIIQALTSMKADRVLPFRFIAAARHAVSLEQYIETAMLKCLEGQQKISGKTVLLIDVSGSMDDSLSSKSDLLRLDAACGLAILLRDICEQVVIITFSERIVQVPARRGFSLRDAINNSQAHAGTYLGKAVYTIMSNKIEYDRLIVITDEQSNEPVPAPKGKGYIINVASNKNGVGYGPWTHIDGWSESIVDYIRTFEND